MSNWFITVMRFFGINKTFQGNIWNDIIDERNGLWAIVYIPCEQVIYKGALRKYEEKDDSGNTYLILSNYIQEKYDSLNIRNFDDCPSNCDHNRVAINTRDISRIELFYKPNSNKLK